MSELYRKVTAALRQFQFQKISGGKGSHEKWFSELRQITVVVPRNLKSQHTANGIMKSAGLKKKF